MVATERDENESPESPELLSCNRVFQGHHFLVMQDEKVALFLRLFLQK